MKKAAHPDRKKATMFLKIARSLALFNAVLVAEIGKPVGLKLVSAFSRLVSDIMDTLIQVAED